MCGAVLAMMIFVLDLFKFPVILNSFTRFPSYTNFIFATVSYCTSSSCCCSLTSSSASFSTMSISRPDPILSINLLYNKEAVSRRLCSLSASASCVAATVADTALYNFEIVFLKNVFIFYYVFEKFFENFMDRKNDTITSKWSFFDLVTEAIR